MYHVSSVQLGDAGPDLLEELADASCDIEVVLAAQDDPGVDEVVADETR
jgi:hypothetical protein